MKSMYIPWLHMHQPLIWWKNKIVNNIQKMLFSNDSTESWNAKLMLRAYKNPARYVKELKEDGYNPQIMLDFSGILLEALDELGENGTLNRVEVDGEKIGNITKFYRNVLRKYPEAIEVSGTAYSHCYFPSTPPGDWEYQIEEWRSVFRKIFGKKSLENVKGFWLPEMGVPAFGDRLEKLIKIISEYYEWLIIPLQAVEGYKNLSYEQVICLVGQPHLLRIENASIPVIIKAPTYFIDQQAGCDVNCIFSKISEAERIFRKVSNKPPLIVPASDGENGNVMMNEFFPKTFVPFFKKTKNESSTTVTSFLHKFYSKNGKIQPKDEIKIRLLGGSWVGGHSLWIEGRKRSEIIRKIYELSRQIHKIETKLESKKSREKLKKIKRMLLVSETSCYVYWGVDFWFNQGEKMINFTKRLLQNFK